MMTWHLSNRCWWSGLGAISTASFAACVLADVLYFSDAPLIADDARFLRSAAGLLADGRFRVGNDVAWEMPGTAIFFAAVSAPGLASPLASIRIANAALVATQSFLLGLLAARIFRDRLAGLSAAAIGGFYPYLVFTQGLAMSETPFDLLLVAGFLATYVWRDQGARVGWGMAAAVAILTAATLVKGSFTILPPILVAAGAIGKRPLAKVVRVLAAATAIYAAVLSPWWIRNDLLLGEFVPFTTSSAFNLYMGNSPNNPDVATYAPYLPGNWAVDHGIALEAIPGELERYRAFRDRAFAYIVEDPQAFVRRAILKLGVFWNIVPNAPAFQKPVYRWVGAATFGPVLALAILSVIWCRRRWLDLLPFYIAIAYFTALHTLTIPSIRYRLPLEPLLMVLAAGPLARLIRHGLNAVGRRAAA
jgi:4-amino-4-deoxy-L-arabinose transferase-like glycosyltransferase